MGTQCTAIFGLHFRFALLPRLALFLRKSSGEKSLLDSLGIDSMLASQRSVLSSGLLAVLTAIMESCTVCQRDRSV